MWLRIFTLAALLAMSCPAQSSEAEPGAAPAADTASLIGVATELKSLSNNQNSTHAG